MSIRPSDCFAEPLQDLGAREPALRGIWIPDSETLEDVRGVSELFLDRSATYHERYTDVAHYRGLLAPVLERLQLPERPVVLDLGSGSGNTVFACLELLPMAHVVATDISPNLLAILRDTLSLDPAQSDRVTVVKMSAMNAPHRESAYDVAVGGAILEQIPGIHASRQQRVALQVRALAVGVRRDTHVANQHQRKTVKSWFPYTRRLSENSVFHKIEFSRH